MKKLIAILLAMAMMLSLAACGGGAEDPNAGKYLGTTAKALGMRKYQRRKTGSAVTGGQ